MGYVVAHARKVKTVAGFGAVSKHNSRTDVYASNGGWVTERPSWVVNPDKAHLNRGDMYEPAYLMKRYRQRIEEAQLKRKPQKNASSAIEIVISATPDHFKSDKDWKKYLEDSKIFLEKRFGRSNLIQFVEHFDETTPHAHAVFVPLVRDKDSENLRFSSADFLGGREGLRQFQTDFAEQVGKKYGLERGSESSKARHTDQKTYPSQVRKMLYEADEKLKKIQEFEESYKKAMGDYVLPPVEKKEKAEEYRERIKQDVEGKIVKVYKLYEQEKKGLKLMFNHSKELQTKFTSLQKQVLEVSTLESLKALQDSLKPKQQVQGASKQQVQTQEKVQDKPRGRTR